MKPFLAIMAGFALSSTLFVGGMAVATYVITAKSGEEIGPTGDVGQDQTVAELWSAEPRRVDPQTQNVQRLPAVTQIPEQVPQSGNGNGGITSARADPTEVGSQEVESAEFVSGEGAIDEVATGSIAPSDEDIVGLDSETGAEQVVAEIPAAHLQWCAARYRSYRPETNTYTSYSGGQRECMSPYLEEALARTGGSSMAEGSAEFGEEPWSASAEYASASADGEAGLMPDHVQSCFERYRSYRPEDNSYQPYGGGPRRQCR